MTKKVTKVKHIPMPPEMLKTLDAIEMAALRLTFEDAERFRLLSRATFLEGTLVLPKGTRLHFEWDADAAPNLRTVLDAFVAGESPRG